MTPLPQREVGCSNRMQGDSSRTRVTVGRSPTRIPTIHGVAMANMRLPAVLSVRDHLAPVPLIKRHMRALKSGKARLHVLKGVYTEFMKYDSAFVDKANVCVKDGIVEEMYSVGLSCARGELTERAVEMSDSELQSTAERVGVADECGMSGSSNVMSEERDTFSNTAAHVTAEQTRKLLQEALQRAETEMLVKSLYIMGMVCFNNMEATNRVAGAREALPLLTCVMDVRKMDRIRPHATREDREKILKAALYLMCNLTANSFDSHKKVLQLLPFVHKVLVDDELLPPIRSEAVRVCFYLSANDDNIDTLLASGIVQPLVDIMKTGETSLDCTSATITISNILGEQQDHPGLDCVDHEQLVDCFEACLEGHDFPQGSNLFYRNWKVAKGLCKLATSAKPRQLLRDHGLVALLEKALVGDNTDGEMHKFSLILLWQLSDQAAHVAAKVA